MNQLNGNSFGSITITSKIGLNTLSYSNGFCSEYGYSVRFSRYEAGSYIQHDIQENISLLTVLIVDFGCKIIISKDTLIFYKYQLKYCIIQNLSGCHPLFPIVLNLH